MSEKVIVLIPIYRADLTATEAIALRRCCSVLGRYTIAVVKPESLNVDAMRAEYPQLTVSSFADDYFKSIYDYNRLLLSQEFYARYLDHEYILIHQLDAYVFRDELHDWTERGYDYIGAPWRVKPKYHTLQYRLFLYIKHAGLWLKGERHRPNLVKHGVGNGGLSLRKTRSHYDAIDKLQDRIAEFLRRSHSSSDYNEDVFWASQPPHFSYPTRKEALLFAFDKAPEIAYKLTHGCLPFGCHGWSKPRYIEFWRPFITNDNSDCAF